MKRLSLTCLSFALFAAPVFAGTEYQITAVGYVDFNGVTSGTLGSLSSGDDVSLSFRVDEDVFVNSASFPTRGYLIDHTSWSLEFEGGSSIDLEMPYSGFGPYFVIRNNDPAVDGFLVSDNVDFPVGVPLDEPGIFGPFEHSFMVTYGGSLLPSLDIADAVGAYGFGGLSVFNWTIDDGPFNPFGVVFQELTIEAITPPLAADVSELSLSAGGTQTFSLAAGPSRASWVYWMFGSVTGTAPGIPFPGGVLLPLNFDPYFNLTLTKPFLGIFGAFIGTLDGDGKATASLTIPPGADPGLVGVTLFHAYLAAPGIGGSDYASNAVSALLVP